MLTHHIHVDRVNACKENKYIPANNISFTHVVHLLIAAFIKASFTLFSDFYFSEIIQCYVYKFFISYDIKIK